MHINRQGTIVLAKTGKDIDALNDLADEIAMYLLHQGAIIQVLETTNAINIMLEHGQVRTPKEISTKLKLGADKLLELYVDYDAI